MDFDEDQIHQIVLNHAHACMTLISTIKDAASKYPWLVTCTPTSATYGVDNTTIIFSQFKASFEQLGNPHVHLELTSLIRVHINALSRMMADMEIQKL